MTAVRRWERQRDKRMRCHRIPPRSLRDAEFLGGVVEGDDALGIEDALGVPADQFDPEAVLGRAQLSTRGGGREVSADLDAGG